MDDIIDRINKLDVNSPPPMEEITKLFEEYLANNDPEILDKIHMLIYEIEYDQIKKQIV